MLIRTEAPADILAIDRLVKACYSSEREANLIMALRENGANTLSLVACHDDGKVFGHLMFSPVQSNGEDNNWQVMVPVSVSADENVSDVASQLISEGLSTLYELGYSVAFALGDASYLCQEFEPASNHNIVLSGTDLPLWVRVLDPVVLPLKSGSISLPKEF